MLDVSLGIIKHKLYREQRRTDAAVGTLLSSSVPPAICSPGGEKEGGKEGEKEGESEGELI